MKKTIALLCIIIAGAIIRLYLLGDLPRGIYVDEASIGYNAWSVLQTGKDEHNKVLPLVFKAFGEYKLPVYIYSSIPFIALFGLNGFSVRIVSALAGIVGIYGIYLVTKEITAKKTIALISAALFAFSPWSIHLSRGGFESNLGLTCTMFAIYFLLKYIRQVQSKWSLAYAAILFILALYTYNAERIFIPLMLIVMTYIFREKLFAENTKRASQIFIIIMIIVGILTVSGSVMGQESARARQVIELENKQYQLGPFLGVLQKYFVHFSPDFLFFSGDVIARHSVRELGELYVPQLPFLLIGLLMLCKSRSKEGIIVLSWLILAPLPAAISTPVPHALRALLMVPPLVIASAIGIESVLMFLKSHTRIVFSFLVTILFAYSFGSYLHVYYKHYVYKSSWDWNEDKSLLAETLTTEYPDASKILIESDSDTMIYIKFFNASHHKMTDISKYYILHDIAQVRPQSGDIVALNGWKGTPEQLTNVKELKMLNNSIGFKVGEWK